VEGSIVYLQRRETDEAVEAELWDDISDEHIEMWRGNWLPLIAQAKQILQANKVPRDKWPQDLHWKWDKKADWSRQLLSLRRFAITCEGDLQGLMLVNLTKTVGRLASQKGKDLAYIEYISTAPWNRPELTEKPIFRGVGLTMVRVAVELSYEEGFHGRIGLHSLSQAATFYRGACGMTDLGPDSSYYGLVYFEMTETQATAFRV
jgi:hypothetical protein